MKKIKPRDSLGCRENGKSSFDLKPFNQLVLTKKEIALYKKLFDKLQRASARFHKAGKCKIENEAWWPCSTRFYFEDGAVHHYPNGYYV